MVVQELRKEKVPRKGVEIEDENYVVRPPIVDLNIPQGLNEFMPQFDEDFYKFIDSEEETKEVIQVCPRNSTMNYSPPSLNENITNVAKKTDMTLYVIQIALAQATRPLDKFFYRKYKEDSEAAKEDEIVALARVGEMAGEDEEGATRLPFEPPSWGPPHNVQESLGATYGQLVGQKKFRERVHNSILEPEKAPATNHPFSTVQEKAEPGIQGGRTIKSGVLQPTLLYPQEDRVAEASLGFKKPEQVCSGKELQDGVSQLYLQVNHEKGLHDVLRSERHLPPLPDTQILSKLLTFRLKWPTVPVQSTAIRPITLAAHLYQGATASTLLEKQGNYAGSIHCGPEQAHKTWVPGQSDKSETVPTQMINHLGMTINSREMTLKVPNSKFQVLRREAEKILNAGCELQFLLWVIESIAGVGAYQRQRTIDNIVRTPAPKCFWLLCASLLRQFNDLVIRLEIWRYNIPVSVLQSRRYMATLFEHKYAADGDVCTIYYEPGGCPKSSGSSNGVVAFPESIHFSEPELCASRR
ncbi:hypothetical protein AYI69_g11316 [Smittium culicis]|uniref:Uncharacterized protein n=1 Tax=Smittium culicis TaxID=133412 RepID=A0A1R1WZJ2_9FUNG|nr:hypothetical protein AYI69_g11316 [Smittium culicis]